MNTDGTVTMRIDAHVVDSLGERHLLIALMHYTDEDAFAVDTTFIAPQRPNDPGVTWTFARELLVTARVEPVGEGDVHAWPTMGDDHAPVIAMLLMSPDGQALVELSASAVEQFINATLQLVPVGAESSDVDFDRMLESLLADRPTASADDDFQF
ncbi:MAG TPA: SsgA family sporulation/cell division regulator [Actinopolymorphaceae bacterium]|jgi:hypothetical protein